MLLGDADVEHLVGKRAATGSRPVESGMAAVIATSSGRAAASTIMASENAAVYEPSFDAADVVHVLDLVGLGGSVAQALAGQDVDHDRFVEVAGGEERSRPRSSWPS